MIIRFKNVLPSPMQDMDVSASEVWQSDFELQSKGRYLINAASGRGKSTFVNILYGLRHDYTGFVEFDGKTLEKLHISDWTSLRTDKLSMVFQSLDLFPNLTVLENILVNNSLTDFKTEKEIGEQLDVLEIDNLRDKLAGTLSMGQQQRVAIVRALCQPFDWLLLDEPFSHLDTHNTMLAWRLIHNEVIQQDAAVMMTTLGEDYAIEPTKTLRL
jgi:putative ABC transport system ATP-binding protein